MATTVTGKLNKAASQFAAGESTGFGVRIGVQYYDRETQQKEWTNYEAAIFAKAPAQVQFYQNALVEGAVVEISGEQLKIRSFDGNNGQMLSIELLNARIGYVFNPNQQQNGQQQQQQQQHGGFNNQRPPQQQQQPAFNGQQQMNGQQMNNQRPAQQQNTQAQTDEGWDDDIPFAPIGLSNRNLLTCI